MERSPTQPFLVAANWKMNLLRDEASRWLEVVMAGLAELAPLGVALEVVMLPPAIWLDTLATKLSTSPFLPLRLALAFGGQDLHPRAAGAFTGSLSGAMLKDAGCRFVLCGHSERRHGLGESDGLVAEKVAAARSAGLRPIVCVGETLEQRRAGETAAVLERQLDAVLPHLMPLLPDQAAIAYEPVWAIGTGQTASPALAREAHEVLRRRLSAADSRATDPAGSPIARAQGGAASRTRILYGGSVNRENARALAAEPGIDGFLVGSAGLDPAHFLDIIRCSL